MYLLEIKSLLWYWNLYNLPVVLTIWERVNVRKANGFLTIVLFNHSCWNTWQCELFVFLLSSFSDAMSLIHGQVGRGRLSCHILWGSTMLDLSPTNSACASACWPPEVNRYHNRGVSEESVVHRWKTHKWGHPQWLWNPGETSPPEVQRGVSVASQKEL